MIMVVAFLIWCFGFGAALVMVDELDECFLSPGEKTAALAQAVIAVFWFISIPIIFLVFLGAWIALLISITIRRLYARAEASMAPQPSRNKGAH